MSERINQGFDEININLDSGKDHDAEKGEYVQLDGQLRETGEAAIDEQEETANSARARSLISHIRNAGIVANLLTRHQIKQSVRSVFDSLGFVEVDTPILGSAMTEYTKDNFKVTGNAGEFYLPQSPQVYKQALVINAFPKYFQFARCFRDEDYGERTESLHEFTQIDLELRCENEGELRNLAEEVITGLFAKFGKECARPFPVIDYEECLAKYGTDKLSPSTYNQHSVYSRIGLIC